MPGNRELHSDLAGLHTAMEAGLSPAAIGALETNLEGHVEDERDTAELKFLGGSVIAVGVLAALSYPIRHYVPPDILVSRDLSAVLDIFTNALNAPIRNPHPSLEEVALATDKAAGTAVVTAGLIGLGMSFLKSMFSRGEVKAELLERYHSYQGLKERGMLPIAMEGGFTAIIASTGTSTIMHRFGQDEGWGQRALPFIEASENHSGSDVWVHLSPPHNEEHEGDYVHGLERGQIENARGIVMIPDADEHTFLPETDTSHISETYFIDIQNRIQLLDQYFREGRRIPPPIIIVADGEMKTAVASYAGKDQLSTSESAVTLREEIEALNSTRPEDQQIMLVDPTEVVLRFIRDKHADQPLELVSQSHLVQQFGRRLEEKCRVLQEIYPELELSVAGASTSTANPESIKVGYVVSSALLTPDTVIIVPDKIEAKNFGDRETVRVDTLVAQEVERLLEERS